jgi:hypothetical protein
MAAYPTIGPQPISTARPESSFVIGVGLNCTTQRIELAGLGRWRIHFNPSVTVSFLPSLDNFIRPLKHTDWNCQTYLLCRFEVDDEFKLGWLLHR